MDIVAMPITEKSLSTQSVDNIEWLVAAQTENPEKTLAVLNLLYSSADFQNLFRYGIEGKDYEVEDMPRKVSQDIRKVLQVQLLAGEMRCGFPVMLL